MASIGDADEPRSGDVGRGLGASEKPTKIDLSDLEEPKKKPF